MSREIGPWSPFKQLRDMQDEMDRMLDQSSRYPFGNATVFPTINVMEDEKNYILEAHVPGFTQDDIDIDVADDMVTISGKTEQREDQKPDKSGYLRREYHVQSFSRTLTLPSPVNNEQAGAKLANGILTVTLPKLIEDKPKTKRLKPTT